jgi:soluble lytic murein transglycosylase-like protein
MIKLLIALHLLLGYLQETSNQEAIKAANPVSAQVKIENVVDKRPNVKGVPLSDDVLDYMYEMSIKYDVAYSLLLSLADVESSFNPKAVSSANCVGLLQLRPSTAKRIAKDLGVKKYNLKNPKDSILFGTYYIDYLRDQWLSKGYSEEDAYVLTIISYNRGIAGTSEWVKEYGFKNKYYEKVDRKKEYYERLINEQNYN